MSGIAGEPEDIVLRDRVTTTTGRRLDRDHVRRNRPAGRRRAGRRGDKIGVYVPIFAVSTVAQTLDQQNDALAKAGVTKTFSDTMSGARDDRPGLCELMSYLRPGDTVVVWKLDRLGRNTLHILETVKGLTDRRVTLAALACVLSVTNDESPQPAVVRP